MKKVEAFAASLCIPGPQCWSFSGEASGSWDRRKVIGWGLVVHVHTERGKTADRLTFFSLAGLVSFFLVLVYRFVCFFRFRHFFLGCRFGRAGRGGSLMGPSALRHRLERKPVLGLRAVEGGYYVAWFESAVRGERSCRYLFFFVHLLLDGVGLRAGFVWRCLI